MARRFLNVRLEDHDSKETEAFVEQQKREGDDPGNEVAKGHNNALPG